MSELTVILIILLIPGAISSIIYTKLTIHKTWSSFEFIVYSTLNGVLCYGILQIIYNVKTWIYNKFSNTIIEPIELKVWGFLNIETIPYNEVIIASIIGVLLGNVLTAIIQNKLLYTVAQKCSVSNKYGDDNLFNHFLNSKEIEEIYIRDIENNLTYHGVLNFFSEHDDMFELVLSDVSVYSYENSDHYYDSELIYLTLNKSNIKIEQVKKDK